MQNITYSEQIVPMPGVQKNIKTNAGIRSDVVLGSPSARCNGVGICTVMGMGDHPDCPCPRITTVLQTDASGNLQLLFPKTALDSSTVKKHFSWGVFQVVEAYRLSARLCRDIGWNGGWINPGVYKVQESESYLVVTFPFNVQKAIA